MAIPSQANHRIFKENHSIALSLTTIFDLFSYKCVRKLATKPISVTLIVTFMDSPVILLPIFLLLVVASLFERKSFPLHIGIGVILWMVFCFMYINVGEIVAQDRNSYYQWYLNSGKLLTGHYDQDMGFTFLLNMIPRGLSENEFGIILASFVYIALSAVVFIAWTNRILTLQQCSLVVLALMMDRVFADSAINTTRSSLVGLVFMLWLVSHKKWLILPIVLFAYGLHERMTFLLFLLYILSVLAMRFPKLRDIIIIAGLMAFVIRLLTGSGIFSGLSLLELYVADIDGQSIRRGFTIENTLTNSLAIQLTTSMIVPMLICYFAQRKLISRKDMDNDIHWTERNKLINSSIIFTSAALILFPDIQLIQRVFVIAMAGLFMMIPLKFLRIYVVAKLAIFSIVIFSMFPG